MRWIFATLLLLNLLYFAWNYWQQLQAPAGQAAVPIERQVEAGERLVLLTERLPAPASPAPPPTIARSPSLPVTRAVERKVCARLGPYGDQEKAGQVSQALANADIRAAISEVVDLSGRQYWVILPGGGTRQKALQLLKELQARNIDSYLITEGELANAISLGLFSREPLATAVRNKVREAGYRAEIHIKERQEKRYWIEISFDQASEKARKVLDELVSDEDGIKISNMACETFAQTN